MFTKSATHLLRIIVHTMGQWRRRLGGLRCCLVVGLAMPWMPVLVLSRAAEVEPGSAATGRLASYTLRTADTTLVLGVSTNQELCVFELSSPGAVHNWTASPSTFPLVSRVDMGGTRHTPRWIFQTGTVSHEEGAQVTLWFTNANPALELWSVWQARPGPGPVRHRMFIKNCSQRLITIYEQETFDLKVAGPEAKTSVWYFNDDGSLPDKVGVYHDQPGQGYRKSLRISEEQDFIPIAVVDGGGVCGAYMGWEWSMGRLEMTMDDDGHELRLKVGNGDEFRTDLEVGETFDVPPGFLGAYRGDLDDGGNSLRQYLFNYSMPTMIRKNPGFPKVEWNAFAPTGSAQGSWVPLERKYYPFIDDIAPLGFEEVVIDVGWWSSYGDPGHIITHPTNWPSGMPAAAKYAHARNLRFGLYDNETEDLTSPSGKQERIADISYLIQELDADFYRSDSTAGPVFKGVHGPGQRARYPEDVGYWTVKGFYEVIDTVYRNIPTFLWECCSGGGRIKDYGVSRRAAKIQNQDRYYPLDARQSFYDTSHVMHPMQIAALDGSWAEWQATGSVFEFRSCSMGAAYWHPDAPNGGNGGPVWSSQQRADIKKAVATYKDKIRPLIRAGYLYHIFPRPDDVVWDGIEYYNPASQEGVVYIFKPKSPVDTQVIKLKGLDPQLTYRLTFEDRSNPNATLSGAELMDHGISITLKGTHVSELMFIQREKP